MRNRQSGFTGILILLAIVGAAFGIFFLIAIHGISTEAGYETVLMDKPRLGGGGGVRPETQKPGFGWYWFSTEPVHVPTTSFKKDEPMDNLPTSKSSLVDMNTYLKLRITDPVRLIKDFGPTWYESNLKEQYRTIVRNETRKHQMEELLTNSTVMDGMEVDIRKEVNKIIVSAKIPVLLEDLSMGKVNPNAPVIIEMDLTAAATQRKKTMVELEQSEIARKKSEEARAEADNAYREKMKLSPAEFVQIEVAKRYSEVCAKKDTHCVINANGNSSVLLQR